MPQTNDLNNLHATALTIGDRGLLIRGASGSGKTTLAVALIAAAQAAGRNARLVSDDQVLLLASGGRLVCRTPPTIAGLVEVRGATPQAIPHEPSAVIDLLVDLVEAGDAPRFSEPQWEVVEGCRLPVLALAARTVHGALPALAATFLLPPFG
jgi:serine kinase of HPr protein (carbohydrate metabolism regulator)